MQAGRWLVPLLTTALVACNDPTGQLPVALPAPDAFRSSGIGTFADFDPLSSSASCVTPPASLPAFATYQPFVIPSGYAQEILLDEVTDFAPVAGSGANLPDMNTLNENGPQAGRFLYRTHEVGSNGAVTVTDLWTGITTLVDQKSHYEALDGIVWTPWGTLLFAEERIVASLKDPAVPNAVGGLVYEWDPATKTTTPRPAIGARSHEGLRFDPQGNLYGISESTQGINGSGAIYKFVPDRRNDLSSGQLYALKVLDPSRTGAAVWVPLDRQAVRVNSDAAAVAAGATGWGRPEDVEIAMSTGNTAGGASVMFVAVTSEDLVLRIELDGTNAWVSNFVEDVSGMTDPDNLALDAHGNLYIAEDRAAGDIWVARRTGGPERAATDVVRFASLSDCSAEPTGIYFDRSSHLLYVNVQHAGGALGNDLTVVITKQKPDGPTRSGGLPGQRSPAVSPDKLHRAQPLQRFFLNSSGWLRNSLHETRILLSSIDAPLRSNTSHPNGSCRVQSAKLLARARALWLSSILSVVFAACGSDPSGPDGSAVDSVAVSPSTAAVSVGSSLSLTAEVLDASGDAIPSFTVTWASEDNSIATVSETGVVTGIRPGTVKIAASSWGKNGVATITVNPGVTVFPEVGRIVIAPSNPRINEGQSIQLAATVLDVEDRVIMGLTITWSSSNTSRATVDNTGLVRGISAGTVNISASAGGKTGSTTVRVER